MGQGDSKELRGVLSQVGGLSKDSSEWRAVLMQFVSLPFEEGERIASKKADIKLYNALLKLLGTEDLLSNVQDYTNVFEAFSRILTSRQLLKELTKKGDYLVPLIRAIEQADPRVLAPALKAVFTLVHNRIEKHKDDAEIEAEIKEKFSENGGYDLILKLVCKFASGPAGTSASEEDADRIVRMALRILKSVIVEHRFSTTYEDAIKLLDLLVKHNAELFDLLHHRNAEIRVIAATLMKFCMLESSLPRYRQLQNWGLDNGALIWQVSYAITENSGEQWASDQREASRELVGLLCDNNPRNINVIRQMVPDKIWAWAEVAPPRPFDQIPQLPASEIKVLLKSEGERRPKHTKYNKQQKKQVVQATRFYSFQKGHWDKMFAQMEQEYATPVLIWNNDARLELKEKLAAEIADLQQLSNLLKKRVEWESEDFNIRYSCLQKYLKAGPYFVDLLVQELDLNHDFKVYDSVLFMKDLYNASVIEDDHNRKRVLLLAMRKVFARHSSDFAGEFEHLPYLVWLLSTNHCELEWKEELLLLLKKLFANPANIKKFIALGGLPAVISHLCLVHKIEYQKTPNDEAIRGEGTSDIPTHENGSAVADTHTTHSPRMANRHLIAINVLALIEAICIFPRSRKALASGNNFQYIIQTLLTDETDVANQVVILLSQIIDSNPFVHPFLYKTGIFIFLMRLLRGGCSDKISSFLRAYHLLQAVGSEDEQHPTSYLEYFLPSPLIAVLNKETGIESFTQAMNSDVMKQDLYWNSKFRDHLANCADEQLADFIALLRTNPESIYAYRTPDKIVYEELDRELCVGNIYLRFFVQDPQPLTENQDPEVFLCDLVASMDSEVFSVTESALFILQAQIELFKMYSEKPKFIEYPGMDWLVSLLAVHNDLSREDSLIRLSRVVELLVIIFRTPNPANAVHNIAAFTSQSSSFDTLLSIVMTLLQAGVHSSVGTIVMENILRILSVLSTTSDMKTYVASTWDMLFCLRKLVSRQQLQRYPATSALALKCIQELCVTEELHPQIVANGVLFSLLDLAVLYPLQLDENTQKLQVISENRICLQAVAALASIAASPNARPVLRKCLTINLYYMLASKTRNDAFLTETRNNMENPLIIWNEHTRQELTELLDRFGVYHINDPGVTQTHFDAATFDFSYQCLADEFVVNNLYVRVFNEQPSFVINNPNPETFLSKLLISLRDDVSVLVELKQSNGDIGFNENEGAVLQALQNSISVKLTAVLNLLKFHNVIGFIPRDENHVVLADLVYFSVVLPEKGSIPLLLQILKVLAKNAAASSCLLPMLLALHRLLVFKHTFVRLQVNQILEILGEASLVNGAFSKRLVENGMILHILLIMATSENSDERLEAARTLGAIVSPVLESNTSAKPQINTTDSVLAMAVLKQLLSPLFRPYLENSYTKPEELIQFFDEDHDSPLIIWNREIRKDLVSFLSREVVPIEENLGDSYITQRMEFHWNPARLQSYEHPSLARELRIGEVFVRNYSENPYFKLDNPDAFLKSLLQQIGQMFGQYKIVLTSGASGGEHVAATLRDLLLMWEAVRCVCENNPKVQPQLTESANVSLLFDHLNSIFIAYIDQDLVAKVLAVLSLLSKNDMFVKSLVATHALATLLQLTGTNNKQSHSVLSIVGDMVIRDHNVARQFRAAGGVLYLLRVLLQRRERNLRIAAAEIMSKLTADATHGVAMSEYLCTFLTPKFASKFGQKAEKFLEYFDADHESDHKSWNESTRDALSFFCEKHVKLLDRSADTWDGTTERFDVALLIEVYPEPVTEPEVIEQEPVASGTNEMSATSGESNLPVLDRHNSFHPENIPLPLSARNEESDIETSF